VQAITHYFVAANDKLLCSVDGDLVLFEHAELIGLNVQIISQYPVFKRSLVSVVKENVGKESVLKETLVEKNLDVSVVAIQESALAGYQWLSLRSQVDLIDENQFQLAGRALQILRWHFDHQYCGRCGKPTLQHAHDLAKTCSNCSLDFYPRLSPCVITLVTRGDYCLLARHKRSTKVFSTCLAGFIEVGETPEQALVREVKEEVNISVSNIRYFTSQPWPFPGQLMLGYFADYVSGDIAIDETEILEAHWYVYDKLPNTPSLATISGRLINAFVETRKALHMNLE
jgi:NAD+ diphosphatase